MVILNATQLYLSLSELDEAIGAIAGLAWLYKAYAQTRLSEVGVHIDLDAVCGYARPLDGLG